VSTIELVEVDVHYETISPILQNGDIAVTYIVTMCKNSLVSLVIVQDGIFKFLSDKAGLLSRTQDNLIGTYMSIETNTSSK